jgi:hypothetical protein
VDGPSGFDEARGSAPKDRVAALRDAGPERLRGTRARRARAIPPSPPHDTAKGPKGPFAVSALARPAQPDSSVFAVTRSLTDARSE